jgi:1,4-dihydroxy-6-naphthoate synthase
MPALTLAHSPDPDDAFMWWPITGKVNPDGSPRSGREAAPAIDTSPFQFRAVPADIEVLNRRAAAAGDLDITALSFRAYCDVKDRYAITRCGSSFGDGFGPKLVARAGDTRFESVQGAAAAGVRIAVPGKRTTAFLLLGMILGADALKDSAKFIELPFDQIIGAVARGEVDAGLVIHEGQLLFEEAGLRLVTDVGAWWKAKTGLPLPLGCNALRRDLDARFGVGSIARVSKLLRASVDYALAHRAESLEYTMPFALANAAKPGAEASGRPTLERVDRYVSMYVNAWTVDMGEKGVDAVRRVLGEGARLGLCPDPGPVDVV